MNDSRTYMAARTLSLLKQTEQTLGELHGIVHEAAKPEIAYWKTAIENISAKARESLQPYLIPETTPPNTDSPMNISRAQGISEPTDPAIPSLTSINSQTVSKSEGSVSKARAVLEEIVKKGQEDRSDCAERAESTIKATILNPIRPFQKLSKQYKPEKQRLMPIDRKVIEKKPCAGRKNGKQPKRLENTADSRSSVNPLRRLRPESTISENNNGRLTQRRSSNSNLLTRDNMSADNTVNNEA